MSKKIKYEFMVEIDLPLTMTDEFIALIPEQRSIVSELLSEKVLTSYSVSLEGRKLWTTVIGESENDVAEVLMDFPIIDFCGYKIFRLTFHNNADFIIPQFSLN
ncbi:MAG TPA: hypothetical protein PKA90_04150 [Ignavibacteria bacterium]|nr:hypothetical protein [Ignavibacteria bacterium]HMR39602.1 hypothetical protein [Ignavibacteria bacterium]